MSVRGMLVYSPGIFGVTISLSPSNGLCVIWQVAALDCGDFYNGQYVKMYSIFMGQLQVMLLLFFCWLCSLMFQDFQFKLIMYSIWSFMVFTLLS